MNVVVLVGRLARDPELRYTNSQMPICRTAIAVDRRQRKDQQSPDGRTADFINITLFGKAAEIFSQYMSKGRQVAIEGRISTGSYQNKEGRTVYTTDVIVDNFDFIGNRNDDGGRGENYGRNSYNNSQGNFDQGGGYAASDSFDESGRGKNQNRSDNNVPEGFSEMDDEDIPF